MEKRTKKCINFIKGLVCTLIVVWMVSGQKIVTHASTIQQLQNQINQHQNQISQIGNKIEGLEDAQAIVEEKIDDLNSEIINTMASIGMKEDEIIAKEAEISRKQQQIDKTQQEYEAAKAREEQQYADMVVRIKKMYENNSFTYLNLFLEGKGLSDILNRMDSVERIYEYDRDKLAEFAATKQQVHDLWDQLEIEKAGLQQDKTQLEADKASLETQKADLDTMLAKKKQESANYEAEINKAKQEAAVAKKLLQQEQKKLQQLQAQQNQGKTAAANGNYATTNYTSTIDNASGSDLGKKVAKYACQYIGNPYVYGGTSLTNGADCSGFVYRVYKDFGYNLPRTSTQQRSAGSGVSYDEAQPGDLICYDGHIGIYIGGGKIVHASTQKTGIKVSNAAYRTILSVRRIV